MIPAESFEKAAQPGGGLSRAAKQRLARERGTQHRRGRARVLTTPNEDVGRMILTKV